MAMPTPERREANEFNLGISYKRAKLLVGSPKKPFMLCTNHVTTQ